MSRRALGWIVWTVGVALLGCPTLDPVTTCASNDDCFAGYGCDTLQSQQCLPACADDDDCIASRYCDLPTGSTAGLCRDGDRGVGDPGGGDPLID